MVQVIEGARLSPLLRPKGRIPRVLTWYEFHHACGRGARPWPLMVSLDTTYAVRRPRPVSAARTRLEGDYVFGGVFFSEFGHFLTETVPNLAAVAHALRRSPGARPLFFCPPNWMDAPTPSPEHPYYGLFLDRFGLTMDDFTFVTGPVEVARLIVDESPTAAKFRYRKWLLDELDAIFTAPASGTRRLYLSRTRWNNAPRIENEDRVEAIFADKGFEIVHLQDHDLAAQIELVGSAEYIAGPQGTALHWSLFTPNCKGVLSLGWPSPLQKGISAARGQRYLDPRGRKPDRSRPRLRAFRDDEVEVMIGRLLAS